jgi:hypothetical protein
LAAETTKVKAYTMSNLLEQAINCDDADRAAKIIQDATRSASRAMTPSTTASR